MDHAQVKKEWEEKLKTTYSDSQNLMNFVLHTLESFGHRYLNDPKIELKATQVTLLGTESNMGQALKSAVPEIREAVKSLAKSVPREQKPTLHSRLMLSVKELSADHGEIHLAAQVNWGHPDYAPENPAKLERKSVFKWNDLAKFRKEFPLALEAACDLFL